MTPDERRRLAETILHNPLFAEVMDQLEQRAIETLIYAATEDARIAAQAGVLAARGFRADLQASLADTRRGKGAPV